MPEIHRSFLLPLLFLTFALPSGPLAALDPRSATPVRWTQAQLEDAQQKIRLSGTLEAVRSATVASEVAGPVVRMDIAEGAEVQRGQVLAQLRRQPLELRRRGAEGQLAEARARLQSSRLKLRRLSELSDSQVVSPQQVDDARYDSEAWQGRVAQLEAEVARLRAEIERTAVVAPFSGVVTRRHTEVGQWLDVGDPVVELLSLESLEARLELPEAYFAQARKGSRVTVRVDALPDREFAGTLRALVPRSAGASRTFPALVSLSSHGRELGVGMLVEVELPIGHRAPSLWVPRDALITRDGASHLFVVDGDRARRVEVEPGSSRRDWVAVRGDLGPGDRVVTRGNERLSDGQLLAAEPLEYPAP